jgi:hypothetical protein
VTKRIRAIAGQAVVMLAIAVGMVVASAAPANAYGCLHDTQDSSSNYEYTTGAGSTGVAMRRGPHLHCDVRVRVPNNRLMEMLCWDNGDPVNGTNTWSYVRWSGGAGDYYGWISDYYITNGGASYAC